MDVPPALQSLRQFSHTVCQRNPELKTVALIVIPSVVLLAIIWLFVSPTLLFRQSFGSYVVAITEGRERHYTGASFRLLQVSYFDPPMLMRPSRVYRIPESSKPSFGFVESETLICIYDECGLGFLMLVDKQTNEWITTSTESHTAELSPAEFAVWCARYAEIKREFPQIPSEAYFCPE